MVTEFGMSKAVGPMNLSGDGEVFVDEITQKSSTSEHLSQLVDSEVKSYWKMRTLRQKYCEGNLETLHSVANRLLETETLKQDEFENLSQDVIWNHNPLVFA